MLDKVNSEYVFSDSTVQLLCSQIDGDYTTILRRHILPRLGVNSKIRLRELRTLMVLDSFGEPVPSAVVADYLRFDKGTVSRAVKVLESLGYISCQPNLEDKRSPLLKVTAKGNSLARTYTRITTAHFDTLSRQLGKTFTEEESQVALKVLLLLRERTTEFVEHAGLS